MDALAQSASGGGQFESKWLRQGGEQVGTRNGESATYGVYAISGSEGSLGKPACAHGLLSLLYSSLITTVYCSTGSGQCAKDVEVTADWFSLKLYLTHIQVISDQCSGVALKND